MVQTCFVRTEIPYSIGSQGPKREIGRERDVLVWQFIDRMYRFYLLYNCCVCLLVYVSNYLFIYLLFIYFICQRIYSSIYITVHGSICLFVRLSNYLLSNYLSIYLSVYLYIYLTNYIFPSFYLSIITAWYNLIIHIFWCIEMCFVLFFLAV